jgi:hypothetical protein
LRDSAGAAASLFCMHARADFPDAPAPPSWRDANAAGLRHAREKAWTEAARAFAQAAQTLGTEGREALRSPDPDARTTWGNAFALVLANLAQAEFQRGRLPNAITAAERALDVRLKTGAPSSPAVIRVRSDLAVLLTAARRVDDAARVLDDGLTALSQSAHDVSSVQTLLEQRGRITLQRRDAEDAVGRAAAIRDVLDRGASPSPITVKLLEQLDGLVARAQIVDSVEAVPTEAVPSAVVETEAVSTEAVAPAVDTSDAEATHDVPSAMVETEAVSPDAVAPAVDMSDAEATEAVASEMLVIEANATGADDEVSTADIAGTPVLDAVATTEAHIADPEPANLIELEILEPVAADPADVPEAQAELIEVVTQATTPDPVATYVELAPVVLEIAQESAPSTAADPSDAMTMADDAVESTAHATVDAAAIEVAPLLDLVDTQIDRSVQTIEASAIASSADATVIVESVDLVSSYEIFPSVVVPEETPLVTTPEAPRASVMRSLEHFFDEFGRPQSGKQALVDNPDDAFDGTPRVELSAPVGGSARTAPAAAGRPSGATAHAHAPVAPVSPQPAEPIELPLELPVEPMPSRTIELNDEIFGGAAFDILLPTPPASASRNTGAHDLTNAGIGTVPSMPIPTPAAPVRPSMTLGFVVEHGLPAQPDYEAPPPPDVMLPPDPVDGYVPRPAAARDITTGSFRPDGAIMLTPPMGSPRIEAARPRRDFQNSTDPKAAAIPTPEGTPIVERRVRERRKVIVATKSPSVMTRALLIAGAVASIGAAVWFLVVPALKG